MSDVHASEAHHGPGVKAYLVVFGALTAFTAVSFIAYEALGRNTTSFVIILAVAFVKAILVAMYFMHLVVDWFRVYCFIIPALVLVVLILVVLTPDIVLGWPNVTAVSPPGK